MNEEERIVILRCEDKRGRPVLRYRIFQAETKFNFDEEIKVVGLSINLDDVEIYRETFEKAYPIGEDGGEITLNLSALEV